MNTTGMLRVRVEHIGDETALRRIVHMVKDAQSTKAPVARIADRVAAVFVPVVIVIAVVAALLWMISGRGLEFSLVVLISVLVISCPCALGLATPLAIIVGTGRAAESGILFRDAAALERSGRVTEIILDKTGTLTEGNPIVSAVHSSMNESIFLRYVASAESVSEHPLGKAIVEFTLSRQIDLVHPEDFISVTGKGLSCIVEGKRIHVGNVEFLRENGVSGIPDLVEDGTTHVYVSADGDYIGSVSIEDPVRKGSRPAVASLKKMDVAVTMVTGDSDAVARRVASEVGIDLLVSKALPEDKLKVIKNKQVKGLDVAMVGDGINDSPALVQADLGMVVGSGTDIAIDCADVILMSDDLRNVPVALFIGRKTLKNIKENLFFAFCYNAVCIPIAAGLPVVLGMSEFMEMPMIAALAMSCSSISVVLNSLRLRGIALDVTP